MAGLLILDGVIEFEDLPVADYLRERPATTLTMPDAAEPCTYETDSSDALPGTL